MPTDRAPDNLTPAEFAQLRSLPPRQAVEAMQARGRVQQSYSWMDVWEEEHGQMFTISRLARADLLDAIRDGLEKSVAGDLTRRDWMRDTEQLLRQAGWWGARTVKDPDTGEDVTTTFDLKRLKLIFDTNTRQAAAAGQWERIQAAKRVFPYLRYVTMGDDKVRPTHAAWNNLTLPVDDPFWQTHMPPNGYNCRCRVISVSEKEYQAGQSRSGHRLNKTPPPEEFIPFVNRRTGEITEVPVGVDPGFAYNPGIARIAQKRGQTDPSIITNKLAAVDPRIATAARADGLASSAAATAFRGVSTSGPRINAWTNPKNGATRIYLNDLPGQGDAKVWITKQAANGPTGELFYVVQSPNALPVEQAEQLRKTAILAIQQRAGRTVTRWADLIELMDL